MSHTPKGPNKVKQVELRAVAAIRTEAKAIARLEEEIRRLQQLAGDARKAAEASHVAGLGQQEEFYRRKAGLNDGVAVYLRNHVKHLRGEAL